MIIQKNSVIAKANTLVFVFFISDPPFLSFTSFTNANQHDASVKAEAFSTVEIDSNYQFEIISQNYPAVNTV